MTGQTRSGSGSVGSDDKPRRRHFVLTSGRSGSNLLVNAMNRHPNVVNYGEVLGEWMAPQRLHQILRYGGRSQEAYLDTVLGSAWHYRIARSYSRLRRRAEGRSIERKPWRGVQSVGVKEFSDHLFGFHLDEYLFARTDIAVVHLRRSDLLGRALSTIALREGGAVSARSSGRDPRPRTRRTVVDIERLLRMMSLLDVGDDRRDLLAEHLGPDRVLTVEYESLTRPGTAGAVFDRVFRFLGVEPVPVQAEHARLAPPALGDRIENLDQVLDALEGTKWAVTDDTRVTTDDPLGEE